MNEELDLSMIRSQRIVKIRREFDTQLLPTHRFSNKPVEISIESDNRPLSLRVAAKVRAVYGGEKERPFSIYDKVRGGRSTATSSVITAGEGKGKGDDANKSSSPTSKQGGDAAGSVDAEDELINDGPQVHIGAYGPHTFGNVTDSSIVPVPKVSTSQLAKEFFADNVRTYNEAIRSTSDIAKEALKFTSALSSKDSKKFACRYTGCSAAFYLSFQCTVHEQTAHGEDGALHNSRKPQRRVPKKA